MSNVTKSNISIFADIVGNNTLCNIMYCINQIIFRTYLLNNKTALKFLNR